MLLYNSHHVAVGEQPGSKQNHLQSHVRRGVPTDTSPVRSTLEKWDLFLNLNEIEQIHVKFLHDFCENSHQRDLTVFLFLNIDCSVTVHHFTFTHMRLLAASNVLPLGCAV
jgi:hypothetical protein